MLTDSKKKKERKNFKKKIKGIIKVHLLSENRKILLLTKDIAPTDTAGVSRRHARKRTTEDLQRYTIFKYHEGWKDTINCKGSLNLPTESSKCHKV